MDFPKSGKVRILVKTGVSETKIREFDEFRQVWRVDVAARPLENEANIEIVKFFFSAYEKTSSYSFWPLFQGKSPIYSGIISIFCQISFLISFSFKILCLSFMFLLLKMINCIARLFIIRLLRIY